MKLSLPAKKLTFVLAICTAALIIGGIVFCLALPSLSTSDILPVTLGILLSALVNIIKVFSLEYQVSKLSKMDDPNKARGFAIGHSLLRFVLTAAGLVAAHYLIPFDKEMHIFNPGLIAAILGAFIWNVSVYILKFVKIDEEEPPIQQ